MNIRPTLAFIAVSLAATAFPAMARNNPVDAVSNPRGLTYDDIVMRRPDFKEPFVRDGIVVQPDRFAAVQPGVPAGTVRELLGQPVRKGDGKHGAEWDYHFKFRLPTSQNYLVCQYKVVFEGAQPVVREAVWRRRQCLHLATARDSR